ncbi:MAG: asparagine synthase-related protein [Egibacteraceae bacterium]
MPAVSEDQDWFAVFADHDARAELTEPLRPQAPQVVTHDSGRPWLMGRWRADQLVRGRAGRVRVAVIGCCPVTTAALSAAAGRIRTAGDVDRLAAQLPGSFHLVAAIGGQIRLQGSVSGLRRVFFTHVGPRVCGVTVASDRADVLAGLAGSKVDERQLAGLLLTPSAPHPLGGTCGWRGVHAVPDGHYLLFDPDRSDRSDSFGRVIGWWDPPDPVLPLTEGAPAVAETLAVAVAARTSAGGTISTDLSGGLDSTTLCCLAMDGPARLIAVTLDGCDPHNDDTAWAKQAAAGLGDVEHQLFDPAQLPPRYADIRAAGHGQDTPFTRVRNATRDTHLARLLVERGARSHLAGHGGDEVLQAPSPYLHTAFRAQPRIAANHLRGWRTRAGWPLAATARQLADRRGYQEWLAHTAATLTAPPAPRRTPDLGWGHALRAVPWATPDAVDAAISLLREAAANAQPFAPTRGQHAALQAIRTGARFARHLSQITARAGLVLELPYFDDRVVEACLAVRLDERATPWRYKPLLVEAMAGVVPAPLLARTTKGAYNADVRAGLRRHRADLAALCDDLFLAQLGLVDAEALRAVCLGLYPPNVSMPAFETTLGAEAWLRIHRDSPVPASPTGAPR